MAVIKKVLAYHYNQDNFGISIADARNALIYSQRVCREMHSPSQG